MRMEFLFSPSANFFLLLGVAWAAVRGRALVGERWLVAAGLVALLGSAALLMRRPRVARAGTIPAKADVRAAQTTNP